MNVDHATGHSMLSSVAAGATITVPVALFLLMIWFLQVWPFGVGILQGSMFPVAVVLSLAASFTAWPVLTTGLVTALLVGVLITLSVRGYAGEAA